MFSAVRVLAYALRLAVIDGEGVSKRSGGRKSVSITYFLVWLPRLASVLHAASSAQAWAALAFAQSSAKTPPRQTQDCSKIKT